MCASHNALLAERDYGRSLILRVRRAKSHARVPHAREPGRNAQRTRVVNGDPCGQEQQSDGFKRANASSTWTKSISTAISKQPASVPADEQSTWPQ
jgi:hypothetical protein